LARGGVRVLCYDQAEAARVAVSEERGVQCVENLAALCARMDGERVIVLSLPAGAAVEDTIRELIPLIATGATLVDAGNSYYRDSMRRALALSQQGLRYIDAGVSGGIHGLAGGYCLMLGGTPKSIEIFEPFARLLAPQAEHGWLHCGPSGAGHFVKMVHNGIEYGDMQLICEAYHSTFYPGYQPGDLNAVPAMADAEIRLVTALDVDEVDVQPAVLLSGGRRTGRRSADDCGQKERENASEPFSHGSASVR
jgi:6-phosphogluconate dehydrogenase (decarboxylating)